MFSTDVHSVWKKCLLGFWWRVAYIWTTTSPSSPLPSKCCARKHKNLEDTSFKGNYMAGVHCRVSCTIFLNFTTIFSQQQAAEINRPIVWSTLLILAFRYTNYSEFRLAAKLIRGRQLLTCSAKLGELSSFSHPPTHRYSSANSLLRKEPDIITCICSVSFKLQGRIE